MGDRPTRRLARQTLAEVVEPRYEELFGLAREELRGSGVEEIIAALSHVPGLRVTARSSAFSFRGKDVEMAEIGRKLGVGHVLEGSVRKAGNRIRVTAQLVKASDSFQAWSGRYDREMTDVFAVQDEIAQAIVEKLKGKLSAAPLASSSQRHSQNLDAYNAYLRGRHYLWRIDVASVNRDA